MRNCDASDQPTLFDDTGPTDVVPAPHPEPWSDPSQNVTDLPGSLRGTGGNHDAHLVELLQALVDRGHDPADLADELWSQMPGPPLAERDWQAIRSWLDVAVRLAPTYKDLEDLRRATRLLLEDRWRVAHWFEHQRRTVEAKQAELATREAGTYWRDRDARRTATRPLHIDVDDDTWSALKGTVVGRGETIGAALGRLVIAAVADGQLPENLTDGLGRRGQPGEGRRAHRFARAAVDDETWRAFRSLASGADVTVAAAVGMVIAAALVQWQPAASGKVATCRMSSADRTTTRT